MTYALKLSKRLSQGLMLVGAAAALFACGEQAPLTDPGSSTNSVTTVSVNPSTASVAVNGTVQLSVTLRDSAGTALPGGGRQISWTSAAEGIATVSASGVVQGASAGTVVIRAESEGKRDSATVTVTPDQGGGTPTPTDHAGYFASTDGSSSADGSKDHPWNLATALAGGAGRVHAGDTIWVRSGTYYAPFKSTVSGNSSAPVVVRAYPGERAVIDGGRTTSDMFVVAGSYTVFWGLEFTNSNPSRTTTVIDHSFREDGIVNNAPHNKYVNLIVHDVGTGFYSYSTKSTDVEVTGGVWYNIGWMAPDRGHGHALYLKADVGPLLVRDNVVFNQFGYGMHIYTNVGDGLLNNIRVEGNVAFDNGSLSTLGTSANIGNLGEPLANGLAILSNMTYVAPTIGGENLRLGSGSGLTATNNYVVGGKGLTKGSWSGSVVMSGNTSLPDGQTASAPVVFVRPNVYESGRGMIVIYNQGGQSAVSVDLGKVLDAGDRYEVRNVQDLRGTPVLSGTYSGGSVSVPMQGVTPPTPVGLSSSRAPRTGPYFDVFIVTKQ